ncbi:hypothetical protein BGZ82_009095 [Podila clonocystis]|nr:hypothetical protein BGZ82_009095 [Podila clonocystis]
MHEHGYRPQYGFVYSPREQFTAEEIHTTTLTYSKNEHLQARPIHSSDQAEMDSREQGLHSLQFKTTPEPMVPAPTSSNKANVRLKSSSVQEPLSGEEQRAGPPQPMPEPTPGQVNTAHAGGEPRAVPHASDRLTVRHYHHETKRRHGVKTIVHRVTTIIMETETFIARPLPTPKNRARHLDKKVEHHHNLPRLGEHVMFDSGEEGDLIVSIVSNEHVSQAKGKGKGKGEDGGL